MRSFSRLLLSTALFLAPLSAHAEQYLTVGAGWFDFNRSDDSSTNFMGEYRGNTFFYGLMPVIGAQVNTDGGAYGYVGLDYDWQAMAHWNLIPGLAGGGGRSG